MIRVSKKFKQLTKFYPSQGILAEKIGVDESTLSLILQNKREATKPQIEAILLYTGWPFEDLFDIDEPSRRKEDK